MERIDTRAEAKGKAGRPPRPMPKPISAKPDEVAEAILKSPPKKSWRYTRGKAGRRG